MKAVHFGAGNIGRGFVGLLLHDAGYEVVFADVNGELIDALAASDHYTVHEVGAGARDRVVDGYRAVNSADGCRGASLDELATADVVTTAVGPRHPEVHRAARGRGAAGPAGAMPRRSRSWRARTRSTPPTCCATRWPSLAECRRVAGARRTRGVREHRGRPHRARPRRPTPGSTSPSRRSSSGRSNDRRSATRPRDPRCALRRRPRPVHRAQAVHREHRARRDGLLRVPRRAYAHQRRARGSRSSRPPSNARSARRRRSSSRSTTSPRQSRRPTALTILERFRNPDLPDTVERVGRQPLRKLGRHERFIGPAAELAERGCPVEGLLAAIGAALRFDVPGRSRERRAGPRCSAHARPGRSCTRSWASPRDIRSKTASSTTWPQRQAAR